MRPIAGRQAPPPTAAAPLALAAGAGLLPSLPRQATPLATPPPSPATRVARREDQTAWPATHRPSLAPWVARREDQTAWLATWFPSPAHRIPCQDDWFARQEDRTARLAARAPSP